MKTLETCFCVVLSLFQLTSSQEASCGDARIVQVSDETRNDSRLHFPWAGVLYNITNETLTGSIRYLCGATLVSEVFCVTGKSAIRWSFRSLSLRFQPRTAFTRRNRAFDVFQTRSPCFSAFTTWDRSIRRRARRQSRKSFCIPIGIHLSLATTPTSRF